MIKFYCEDMQYMIEYNEMAYLLFAKSKYDQKSWGRSKQDPMFSAKSNDTMVKS